MGQIDPLRRSIRYRELSAHAMQMAVMERQDAQVRRLQLAMQCDIAAELAEINWRLERLEPLVNEIIVTVEGQG